MKRITLLFLIALTAITTSAQTPLTTAVDFTATDVEGHEHNLFQVLDSGQYVLIDFFFTTCGPCQDAAPKINEAYIYFGCNNFNVVFWAMDTGDTDAECIAFDEQFGVEYPTISGVEGGGTAICNTYQIPYYPTVILIAPDHTIVEQDIWPIPSAQTIIDILEGHGITQNDCTVGITDMEKTISEINIYPNPAHSQLNIDLSDIENYIHKIQIIDIVGKVVRSFDNIPSSNNNVVTIDINDINEGMFFINITFNDQQITTKKINIAH